LYQVISSVMATGKEQPFLSQINKMGVEGGWENCGIKVLKKSFIS